MRSMESAGQSTWRRASLVGAAAVKPIRAWTPSTISARLVLGPTFQTLLISAQTLGPTSVCAAKTKSAISAGRPTMPHAVSVGAVVQRARVQRRTATSAWTVLTTQTLPTCATTMTGHSLRRRQLHHSRHAPSRAPAMPQGRPRSTRAIMPPQPSSARCATLETFRRTISK